MQNGLGGHQMNKQKLELNELILKVQKALKEAQYSEMRIATFFPTWAKLTEYMTQRNEQILDAKTGLNFLEEAYGITVFKNLPRNLAICARAVNVLTDYQQQGMLLAKARRKAMSTILSFRHFFRVTSTNVERRGIQKIRFSPMPYILTDFLIISIAGGSRAYVNWIIL